MINMKHKIGRRINKYLLSIDFQVNCRKFILTSLLFFVVAMTYAASIYTGFYEVKGIGFNAAVCVILLYGLIVGFFCSDMNKYQTRTLLGLLNVLGHCMDDSHWFICNRLCILNMVPIKI